MRKFLIGAAVLAVLALVLLPSDQILAQYRGSNLYFGGDSVSGGETLPDGSWVSRINSSSRPYYPTTNGVRESGVYPLPGYEDIDPYGSAGYVMPNKQNNGTRARGVADGGGAVGTRALSNMSETEKTSSSAAANRARKQKMFNFLQSKNQSGSAWERMGSAHIVHQMLGRSAPWGESGRVISQNDWNTLRSRLVENPEIWMVYVPGQSVAQNTAGVQIGAGAEPRIDVIDDNNPYSGAVWAFRRGASPTNSTNVYMLEVICANPVGSLGGLPPHDPTPPIEYSLTPTLTTPSANSTEKRGETIVAAGRVVNVGDAAGTKDWYVSRYKAGSRSGSRPGACDQINTGSECVSTHFSHNFTAGGTANATRTGSMSSFTVPSDAKEGDRYCWVVSVRSPTEESNNPAWSHSTTRCITVAKEYTLTPSIVSISPSGEVSRGDDLTIESRVRNSGPDESLAGQRRITMLAYQSTANPNLGASTETGVGCSAFPTGGRFDSSIAPNCVVVNTVAEASLGVSASNRDRNRNDEYTVNSGYTVGTKLCFVVSVSRHNENSSTSQWRHSDMRCVEVSRDFTLTPILADTDFFDGAGDNSVAEPGADGTIEHSVSNDGLDDSSEVEWRLTYYKYRPGATLTPANKAAKESPSETRDPCAAFPGGASREICTYDGPEGWREENQIFRITPTKITPGETISFTVPTDTDIGTKFCWVASVRPPTADSASDIWKHSAMRCIIVGKKPKVQVWGGDVRAGGEINTSTSTIDGQTYGSWGEYAALSNRQNSGFATGSGLNEGAGSLVQSTWSELTFANTGINPGCSTLNFGCYGFTLASPIGAQPLVGQFKLPEGAESTLGSSVNLNSLASGTYKRIGNISLTSTTISPGKSIVIEVTGTVTISDDIRYSDEDYSSVYDIPQVVIRAPVINIEDRVRQVDAWLLAVRNTGGSERGRLNTCSNRTGGLTANVCDRLLTINGPVVAEQVLLRRTAGSGATASERHEPAEIFNLRADAYLWGRGYGSHSNQVRTVHIRELAPRF